MLNMCKVPFPHHQSQNSWSWALREEFTGRIPNNQEWLNQRVEFLLFKKLTQSVTVSTFSLFGQLLGLSSLVIAWSPYLIPPSSTSTTPNFIQESNHHKIVKCTCILIS